MADMIVCAHERTPTPSMEERMMHSHDTYEVYYLLSGDADFLVEATRYHLHPGDLLLMRKGEVHMFRLRSAAPYERMHVNFDVAPLLSHLGLAGLLDPFQNRPLGTLNHYPAANFSSYAFKQDLERLCGAKEEEKLLFIAEEAKVYISPYAESVGVRGNGIDTDAQGFAHLRVRLS
jgi:hypothetical protein